jgi:UDP-galactopyranose mutase
MNYLVVGAGFSGAVLAREIVENDRSAKVLIIDERSHIAGNCHTQIDEDTGIQEHVYGPHIFHTSREDVWEYVNKYTKMMPFTLRTKAFISKGIFSLPINLHTINQLFGKKFNPNEARIFIQSLGDHTIINPQNFEEQALKFIGSELYYSFFHGYTVKQWGCDPKELPASILKRLPIRFNYDDNYFKCRYQGMPENGYTELIANIINHPQITTKLNVSYERDASKEFDATFYTGGLDRFFDYSLGNLSYRTVFWEKYTSAGDFQGNAIMNYTEQSHPYTRIHEHKHFAPWETHDKTISLIEYSKETQLGDIPYYPKRLSDGVKLFDRYSELANNTESIYFLGRLATYRYLDMHQVIGEALDFSKAFLMKKCTKFSHIH